MSELKKLYQDLDDQEQEKITKFLRDVEKILRTRLDFEDTHLILNFELEKLIEEIKSNKRFSWNYNIDEILGMRKKEFIRQIMQIDEKETILKLPKNPFKRRIKDSKEPGRVSIGITKLKIYSAKKEEPPEEIYIDTWDVVSSLLPILPFLFLFSYFTNTKEVFYLYLGLYWLLSIIQFLTVKRLTTNWIIFNSVLFLSVFFTAILHAYDTGRFPYNKQDYSDIYIIEAIFAPLIFTFVWLLFKNRRLQTNEGQFFSRDKYFYKLFINVILTSILTIIGAQVFFVLFELTTDLSIQFIIVEALFITYVAIVFIRYLKNLSDEKLSQQEVDAKHHESKGLPEFENKIMTLTLNQKIISNYLGLESKIINWRTIILLVLIFLTTIVTINIFQLPESRWNEIKSPYKDIVNINKTQAFYLTSVMVVFFGVLLTTLFVVGVYNWRSRTILRRVIHFLNMRTLPFDYQELYVVPIGMNPHNYQKYVTELIYNNLVKITLQEKIS
ncbi:MAG: hypothetical protein IH840_10185 [Candidatus Heimdallarchaeota archaeon]|nr:hypothetical protein [Candidatus Heimdallarchaeota archaeon]